VRLAPSTVLLSLGKFEALKVWQRAKDLAVYVYKLTSSRKDFGLKDQMRRTAVSALSNISEGDEYGSDKQAIRFFRVAKGSAELLTQSIIAREFDYIQEECKGTSAMPAKLIHAQSRADI
jgi:four helix bundle protein